MKLDPIFEKQITRVILIIDIKRIIHNPIPVAVEYLLQIGPCSPLGLRRVGQATRTLWGEHRVWPRCQNNKSVIVSVPWIKFQTFLPWIPV